MRYLENVSTFIKSNEYTSIENIGTSDDGKRITPGELIQPWFNVMRGRYRLVSVNNMDLISRLIIGE